MIMIENMIKALKCVASQTCEGDCYADIQNFMHIGDDKYKRLVCKEGENLKDFISGNDAITCPYHQKEYGTCFEDGELYWLKDVAELLEKQIPKQPYFENYYWATWTCPCCRTRYEIDYEQHKHCPECGQAIDWGEKND